VPLTASGGSFAPRGSGEIVTVVALAVDHCSVVWEPAAMDVEADEKLTVGGDVGVGVAAAPAPPQAVREAMDTVRTKTRRSLGTRAGLITMLWNPSTLS
jgi:hypothetical protein